MTTSTLSTTLSSARDRHGHTRADLARLLGCSRRAPSRWELSLARPAQRYLPQLAAYCGVEIPEMRRLVDEAPICKPYICAHCQQRLAAEAAAPLAYSAQQ